MHIFFLFLMSCSFFAIYSSSFDDTLMQNLSVYEKGSESPFIASLTAQDYADNKASFHAALYFAVMHNKVKSVAKLLSLGVDGNAVYGGRTIVSIAINHQVGDFQDRLAIITLFLAQEVYPQSIDISLYRNKNEKAIIKAKLAEHAMIAIIDSENDELIYSIKHSKSLRVKTQITTQVKTKVAHKVEKNKNYFDSIKSFVSRNKIVTSGLCAAVVMGCGYYLKKKKANEKSTSKDIY